MEDTRPDGSEEFEGLIPAAVVEEKVNTFQSVKLINMYVYT